MIKMLWQIYALLMGLIFVILWFGYAHDLIAWKVIGYGFLFILNFPFINPLGMEQLEIQRNYTQTEVGNVFYITPYYDTYTNLYIFSFLAILGVYGSVLFTLEEIKFRREEGERK